VSVQHAQPALRHHMPSISYEDLKQHVDYQALAYKDDDSLQENAPSNYTASNCTLKMRKNLKGHFAKVYAVQWCLNEQEQYRKLIVSASQDAKLIVWDAVSTNKKEVVPLQSSWVMTCGFSPTGTHVACGGLDNICSIYPLTGPAKCKVGRELAGHTGYLSCCRFFADGNSILTSSGDMTSMVWDVETGQDKMTFSGHDGDVMCISMMEHDNNLFVSGACDATAMVWDLRDSTVGRVFEGHESDINAVKWFPDGCGVFTGSDDASLRLFGLRSHHEIQQFSHDKVLCGVTSIDCSFSGRYVFGGYDDFNCYVWDTISGKQVCALAGHDNRVSSIGLSYEGCGLCTASWDSFLKIWA